jgi:hypothetical protein
MVLLAVRGMRWKYTLLSQGRDILPYVICILFNPWITDWIENIPRLGLFSNSSQWYRDRERENTHTHTTARRAPVLRELRHLNI